MTVAVRKNPHRARGGTERQRLPTPPGLLATRVPPSACERPAPGSEEARDLGCFCKPARRPDWGRWITMSCRVHDPVRDEE